MRKAFSSKAAQQHVAFITSNEGKAAEVRAMMRPTLIDIIKLTLPEVQGESEFIAREKAKYACAELQRPVFVDDTQLCFSAWDGLPGPYISSFIKRLGPLKLYHLLDGQQDKAVNAVCTIAYCEPGKDPVLFVGEVYGTLVPPRRNTDRTDAESFGWDPIFQPMGSERTFGEMSLAEKNRVSHRGLAVQKFKEYLRSM
ncbi:non-canonical purine NTP pyrophosphatase [Candidatus Woesearchaeota archaeon]|nr:non-canonical purine NTP pyrophosphatase [Candidatus Woesearchaeota archaeon]